MHIKKLQLSTDSCSLILLKKANLLKKYSNFCAFHVSNLVRLEINRDASFRTAADLITHQLDTQETADASVISLYKLHNLNGVLSDDAKVLIKCNKQDIPHYCCLSLCALLAQYQYIPVAEAQADMLKFIKIGRYAKWVQNYAFEMLFNE